MVHQTFYNLKEEKQLQILNAVKKEIVVKGKDNAKVVNICKEANIPRSAFYRYFDSLYDAINALVDHIHGKQASNAAQLFNSNKNFLDASIEILKSALANEEDYIIIKYNMTEVRKRRDHEKVVNLGKDERVLFEMLVRLIGSYTVAYYERKEPKDEIIEKFTHFIKLLKERGF